MKGVRLRALASRLAAYVRKARAAGAMRAGEVSGKSVGLAGLAALAARSETRLGACNDPKTYPELPRLLRRRHASELLDEERGSH